MNSASLARAGQGRGQREEGPKKHRARRPEEGGGGDGCPGGQAAGGEDRPKVRHRDGWMCADQVGPEEGLLGLVPAEPSGVTPPPRHFPCPGLPASWASRAAGQDCRAREPKWQEEAQVRLWP